MRGIAVKMDNVLLHSPERIRQRRQSVFVFARGLFAFSWCALGCVLLNQGDDLVYLERLSEKSDDAGEFLQLVRREIAEAADHDGGNTDSLGCHEDEKFGPVDARHVHVEKKESAIGVRDVLTGLAAVVGNLDAVSFLLEGNSQGASEPRVIIYNKNHRSTFR